jgi:anthranilate phosphoribosyltransferase
MHRTLTDLGGWSALLGPLTAHRDLTTEQARAGMTEILEGSATPAQIAGFAVALRMKGETVDELSGLLDALLGAAELVVVDPALHPRLVDVVGTGGDRSHSINVSTISMLVVAGAGVPICKHGNRAASSSCGAADLLAELGVAIELGPTQIAACLHAVGVAFCFAPRFHPALRHAGPTRRELGVPTAFNILGPMANPARVQRQVVGIADPTMADKMLGVLQRHGARRVMIVHGGDGLDELTTTGTSQVWELDADEVRSYELDPSLLGLARATGDQLTGGLPPHNAEVARAVLAGQRGPHRDIVLLNAAAGLLVGERVSDLAEGIELAAAVLDDGRAAAALDRLVTESQRLAADAATAAAAAG